MLSQRSPRMEHCGVIVALLLQGYIIGSEIWRKSV